MVRKYGLTIDSLLSAEVVTADGRLVRASVGSHEELFWALRGGGGNFGVVTGFEFQLRPVGTVLGGAIIHRASAEVLREYNRRALEAPDGLTTIAMVMRAPPLPFIPAELHGQVVLMILLVYVGDLAEGQAALEPLRTLSPSPVDLAGPMPYPAIFDLTRGPTHSSHHYGRTTFLDAFPDPLIETVLDFVERGSSPLSFAQIRPLGGQLARVPADATAFAHRDRAFQLALINDWEEPGEDAAAPHKAWIDAFLQEVRPYGGGVYVNFLELGEPARIREAYPNGTYDRLVAVKRLYDPTNFYRLNHNIRPTG
jgi:FAD/FMN-containing dehydrogenase